MMVGGVRQVAVYQLTWITDNLSLERCRRDMESQIGMCSERNCLRLSTLIYLIMSERVPTDLGWTLCNLLQLFCNKSSINLELNSGTACPSQLYFAGFL